MHILAIFPYDADVDAVNRAADKILDGNSTKPIISSDGVHREFTPDKLLIHCLPEFCKETSALLIPAHPQEDKGLLTSFNAGEAVELISYIQPDAVESFDQQSRKRMIDTAKIRPDALLSIASIENSDNLRNRVRIQVEHRALQMEYAESLSVFFSGSRISRESFSQIAHSVPDGIELANLARQGKSVLMEETRLSDAYADRLLNFLNEKDERWFDLELLAAEDDVQIELNLNGNWQRLQKLSDGQRATAMLLILLTQTNRPMLVDQPEDDLDNRFIFDDVVQMLRAQKGLRQLIAATHNPNIPVLAHAELVLGLEAESNKMQIAKQGGMDKDDIQDFVRKVMEGGEEAFRRRAEKYGMEI